MKLKKIMLSTIIGLAVGPLGATPLTTNASTWKKGLPRFAKISANKRWMSTSKKHYKGDVNDRPYYIRTSLTGYEHGFNLNYSAFYNNGKRNPNTMTAGYPIMPKAYYKKVGRHTYQLKTHVKAQNINKDRMELKKDGKQMKVWIKDNVGKHWKYYGKFKKVHSEDLYKHDPLR